MRALILLDQALKAGAVGPSLRATAEAAHAVVRFSTLPPTTAQGTPASARGALLGQGVALGVDTNGEQVFLSDATLAQHTLVLGATGAGKSETVRVLADKFLRRGWAGVVVDLKGDMSAHGLNSGHDDAAAGRQSLVNRIDLTDLHSWGGGHTGVTLQDDLLGGPDLTGGHLGTVAGSIIAADLSLLQDPHTLGLGQAGVTYIGLDPSERALSNAIVHEVVRLMSAAPSPLDHATKRFLVIDGVDLIPSRELAQLLEVTKSAGLVVVVTAQRLTPEQPTSSQGLSSAVLRDVNTVVAHQVDHQTADLLSNHSRTSGSDYVASTVAALAPTGLGRLAVAEAMLVSQGVPPLRVSMSSSC